MASAQIIALYLAAFVIPVVGQIIALFTPLPSILLTAREGISKGVLALGSAALVIALAAGWQLSVFFILTFGLMALGISFGMQKKMQPEYCSLLGGLLPALILGSAIALSLAASGRNSITVLEQFFQEHIREAASFYAKIGLQETAASVQALSDRFVYYAVRVLPGIVMAASIVQAALCYGIALALLAKKPGMYLLPNHTLDRWHAPDSWVWGLIVALGLLVFPDNTLHLIGWNLTILHATVYLIQGIAIVEFGLKKMQLRIIPRMLIQGFIVVLPSIVFVIGIGLIDIWSDFRKLRKPEQSA